VWLAHSSGLINKRRMGKVDAPANLYIPETPPQKTIIPRRKAIRNIVAKEISDDKT